MVLLAVASRGRAACGRFGDRVVHEVGETDGPQEVCSAGSFDADCVSGSPRPEGAEQKGGCCRD